MTDSGRNDFLVDLLALQQDGAHAISAPTNWTTHEPLLQVATDIDEVVEELRDAILVGSEANQTGRWHFFVGSPGNGKSAAMGKLCRQLISVSNCRIRDENGTSIDELDGDAIPYLLNVYEGDNAYPSAQIVQDASVVRNPFAPNVDPAAELVETLKRAWEKGISLVVCTNRGVLEKAHQQCHLDYDVNSTDWYKILSDIVSAQPVSSGDVASVRELDAKKRVFQNIHVKYNYLDNRSLLLESDTLSRLIRRATSANYWKACESCPARLMCPFFANRAWLADPVAVGNFIKLLKRAEVLSGQVIVFREALALISLVLAGCARDYKEMHPCEWVQAKVARHDIFALASRRIYMSMFASHCRRGFEAIPELRNRQLDTLLNLKQNLSSASQDDDAASALKNLKTEGPSTDVGLTRLLGEQGIIAALDPCRSVPQEGFYDRWDTDLDAVVESGRGTHCFTGIERACISTWKELEECLESASDHTVSTAHWALRRWSSNFLMHFGALLEGRSAWEKELDKFARLLGLMAKPAEMRSIEEKLEIKRVDSELAKLVNAVGIGQSSAVQLSESVTLSGRWVDERLKPKTVANASSGSASLTVRFNGGERAVLSAHMFAWLDLLANRNLDHRCFPQDLFAGVADARVRAAAKSGYARENDNIQLFVETRGGESFTLTRIDGEVDVS